MDNPAASCKRGLTEKRGSVRVLVLGMFSVLIELPRAIGAIEVMAFTGTESEHSQQGE